MPAGGTRYTPKIILNNTISFRFVGLSVASASNHFDMISSFQGNLKLLHVPFSLNCFCCQVSHDRLRVRLKSIRSGKENCCNIPYVQVYAWENPIQR